jgi:hypothetical protein
MYNITAHAHFDASLNTEDALLSRSNVDKYVPYDKEWTQSLVNLPSMASRVGSQYD